MRAIWAIPEAVPDDLGADKVDQLGKLLGMTSKELRVKLSEDKSFVYVKRQVPIDIAAFIPSLIIGSLKLTSTITQYIFIFFVKLTLSQAAAKPSDLGGLLGAGQQYWVVLCIFICFVTDKRPD